VQPRRGTANSKWMLRNQPQPPPPPGAWLRPELVSSWREIILVILVMVGPFMWHSTLSAWSGSATRFLPALFSDRRLLASITSEGILFAFFLWLLHRRGWNVSDFRIRLGIWSTGQGLLLLAAVELSQIVVKVVLMVTIYALQGHKEDFIHFAQANNPHLLPHSITVSWSVLTAAMVLNAYFEEMICTGYVFTQLAEKWGPFLGLTGTLALRLACHTYQGPTNVAAIGSVFLLFGLWYWKSRNLWPLIVAHALLDICSGTLLKLMFG